MITVWVAISVLGSATIFVPETFMPFLSSLTDAGLPFTTNFTMLEQVTITVLTVLSVTTT